MEILYSLVKRRRGALDSTSVLEMAGAVLVFIIEILPSRPH
jgi:hypothetical protein